jgi:hypothetical protein
MKVQMKERSWKYFKRSHSGYATLCFISEKWNCEDAQECFRFGTTNKECHFGRLLGISFGPPGFVPYLADPVDI